MNTKYKMLSLILMGASMATLAACSDDEPVLTDRDWSTDTFFSSPDAQKQDIFYKPYVGYVGDPMPFYDPQAGDFKILYLQDYRPNQAYTYHPVWAVSTKDAVSYTSLGELVPCGNAAEIDAALGTGSTIFHDGTYYTFYTGHSANAANTGGFGEAVLLSTSTDFKTWTKDREFIITGGDTYDKRDFRDPFVFRADDGTFRMLVSTKQNGKGVLAEYSSADLRDWKSEGVFMTMMWDRFYECPDVFKMGDWWYLVYSEMHDAVRRVQYFKGRTLDELKATTAGDAGIWPDGHEGFLDSRGFYAGKTASDGTDRYIWGWCATRAGSATTGNRDWAGNLVAHKLVQHPDGTLTLGEVPAMPQLFASGSAAAGFSLGAGEHRLMPRLASENRISMTVTTAGPDDRFGISVARGSDSQRYYTLVVNPEGNGRRKINLEEEGPEGAGFLADNDSYVFDAPADNVYDITIVTDNSVLVLYINDTVAYTNRIYGMAKNCWSVNSYDGSIEVSDISIAKK